MTHENRDILDHAYDAANEDVSSFHAYRVRWIVIGDLVLPHSDLMGTIKAALLNRQAEDEDLE